MSSANHAKQDNSPTQNGINKSGNSDTEEEEEICELNQQLDVLNSALDSIEEKNDHIKARLLELLKNVQNVRTEQSEGGNENDKSESDR